MRSEQGKKLDPDSDYETETIWSWMNENEKRRAFQAIKSRE